MMAKHPEIPHPRVEVSPDLIRPFTRDELLEIIRRAERTSVGNPFVTTFRSKFGDSGLFEIASYASSKLPRQYMDYLLSIGELAGADGVSVENSVSVRDITNYVLAARTVDDAKSRIDTVMKDYVGVSSYTNPAIEVLALPLSLAKIKVAYPPERVGAPRILRTDTSWEVLSYKDIDSAEITPTTPKEKAEGGNIFGPRLEIDEPVKCEVRFTPGPRKTVDSNVVCWALFEMRWCWWVQRAWLPFNAGSATVDFPEEAVIRFSLEPDKIRVFAFRIQPFAVNATKCSVRRIA